MALISDLKPLNLQEEKEKFFQNPLYNPQFSYVRDFSQEELTKYGLPQEKYFLHAQAMLKEHGNYVKNDIVDLNPKQILDSAHNLFRKLSIPPLELEFTEKQDGRVILKKDVLKFRLPVLLNKNQVKNVLNHEIQTHYLRRINDKLQNLNSSVKSIAFRKTEEGLANLHSFIENPEKIIKKTYANYTASYLAQKFSFSELYHALREQELNKETAWNVALKQKRGLKDTSQPGGFSKALVYFEGIVAVWNWMQNPQNDPKDLYLGRISLDDVPEIKLKTDATKTIYPTFFADMDAYKKNVAYIGEINKFSELLP